MKTSLSDRSHVLDTRLFSWEPKRSYGNGGSFLHVDCGRAIRSEADKFCLRWTKAILSASWAICRMISIGFETLIDDSLSKITNVTQLKTMLNKRVLSLINDFEGGKWQHGRFQNYLWDNIAQTALSERERMALVNQSHSTLEAVSKGVERLRFV